MNKKPKLLVVGSLVMDLIVSAERFPNTGETVIGTDFSTAPGGKGANQAVQAALLGADVTLVGMVGCDDFGKTLISAAKAAGVDTSRILTTDGTPTAVGNVQIQQGACGTDNRIIVVPGANYALTTANLAFLETEISQYDMVILQLEIGMPANRYVASLAKAAGVPVFLNPAPWAPLPWDLLACITYICPNEHEAEGLTGIAPSEAQTIAAAAEALRGLGPEAVIITLGKEGSFYYDGKQQLRRSAAKGIHAVDPTAAGDSFIGAFCTALAAGIAPAQAMEFANCTAGITVSKTGAQPSLPSLKAVLSFMESRGYDTAPFAILNGGEKI